VTVAAAPGERAGDRHERSDLGAGCAWIDARRWRSLICQLHGTPVQNGEIGHLGEQKTKVISLQCAGPTRMHRVSQCGHEIGIRLALGATPRKVVAMVLGDAGKLIAAGLALGIGVALAVTRYLKSLLYEVSPFDRATFAAVALFLAAVALAASFVRALRATSVDPSRALHPE
jgi:hypothetical protein